MAKVNQTVSGVYNTRTPAQLTWVVGKDGNSLYEPRRANAKADPKYSAMLLFSPSSADVFEIDALCRKIAADVWPAEDYKRVVLPGISGEARNLAMQKRAAKDGKPVKDRKWLNGKWTISASSPYQPKLAGVEAGKIVKYETDAAKLMAKERFFNGAEAFVQLNFVAYESDIGATPGISAYLNLVLVNGKGTRIGGSGADADVFASYIGSLSDVNPLVGDEIPF
jgi:hypothetical protein